MELCILCNWELISRPGVMFFEPLRINPQTWLHKGKYLILMFIKWIVWTSIFFIFFSFVFFPYWAIKNQSSRLSIYVPLVIEDQSSGLSTYIS